MSKAFMCELQLGTLTVIVFCSKACWNETYLALIDRLRALAEQDLILDLEGIDGLSQQGLVALVTFGQEREKAGHKLVLCHVGDGIKNPMERLGVSPHFTLVNSVAEAIDVFCR